MKSLFKKIQVRSSQATAQLPQQPAAKGPELHSTVLAAEGHPIVASSGDVDWGVEW